MSISAIHHQWNFDAPIVSLCANRNGDYVAASFGDGSVRLFAANEEKDEPKYLVLHEGVSLSLRPDADAHAFLSGGDDGKVFIIDPVLGEKTLLAEHKNQWIDHVAASLDGKFRAYNTGKKIHVIDEEGKAKFAEPLTVPSNPGDIAFSPNGKRLAISHYNGVSVFWLNAKETTPVTLPWKGSHLDLLWSTDGKALMTSMQESALHGWHIADGKEMRMQGYAAKIKSMGWTVRGKFLATSGADQIICWTFSGGGPWGKPPVTLGGQDKRLVTQVAPHPKDEMVAAGYDDGMIVLAPLDGRMEIMINPPSVSSAQSRLREAQSSRAQITGLVWNHDGSALFAATESGTILLFTIDSVRKALVHKQ